MRQYSPSAYPSEGYSIAVLLLILICRIFCIGYKEGDFAAVTAQLVRDRLLAD